MLKRISITTLITVTFALTLVSGLYATTQHSSVAGTVLFHNIDTDESGKDLLAKKKDKDDNDEPGSSQTFYVSAWVGSEGASLRINPDVKIKIKQNALNDYLDEQGIDEIEVTVSMTEFIDENGDLERLEFEFAPTGAYFSPEAELYITGTCTTATHVLYAEDGSLLEYTVKKNAKSVTYYLPHFSSYIYDHYDY